MNVISHAAVDGTNAETLNGARRARAYVALARPSHWAKNAFVLAPLVFAPPDYWRLFWREALLAAACFCLMSSAIYAVNDAIDATADRRHPRKQNRPVAAGVISPAAALSLALVMAALGGTVALRALPAGVVWCVAAYAANNVAYNALLKHKVIADVISIAAGFVIRLVAGAAAIQVTPSSWLLVCGFSLALVLGFGKRRAELAVMGQARGFRTTLDVYTPEKLDHALAVMGAITLLSYMLYTLAPDTKAVHGTDRLVWTVPLVVYGLFRFTFKVQEGAADGPVELLRHDPVMILNVCLWLATVVFVLRWL